MAGQSTSTLSALLQPNVDRKLADLLYRETDYLNFLRMNGRVSDLAGPSPHAWNVVTDNNDSTETYAEGQAPPAADKQTYVQTSLSHFRVRGVFGRTGDQRDNEAKANAYYTPPQATEQELASSDVMKALEDQLVGSTQDRGYASIIDATGTYAGLSQSTYSIWASQEDGTIGTLGIDNLEDLYKELRAGVTSGIDRNAKPTHVLMPITQATNYGRTVGTGAATSLYRFTPGQAFDPGMIAPGMFFNTLPIVIINGQTSTEIYMVDVTDIELLIVRDLRIDPITGNPEMESFQVSTHVMHKVKRRNKHGKLTGVTA